MLRITDIDYIKDYQLLVTFNDGQKKLTDLEPYLTGEVFGELKDKHKFIQYGLTRLTIEWANGADLAPEFLYEIGIPVSAPKPYAPNSDAAPTLVAEP